MSTYNIARGFTPIETSRSCIIRTQIHEEEAGCYVSQGHQDTEDACVNRYGMQYNSSRSRFLQWMIYCRNTSAETKDLERRTCPYLWCREVWPSEQDLVNHVRSCPELSKGGDYWCSICSKPEKYLQELPHPQPSQEELVTRAKETISVLGIGSVVEVSQRKMLLPEFSYPHSELNEIGGSCVYELASHRSTSELDECSSFPTLFELPVYTPLGPEVEIRSQPRFQAPSTRYCGQFQDAFRFPKVYRQRFASQMQSSLRGWKSSTRSLPPTSTHMNGWSNDLVVSRSKFRQMPIPEDSVLSTSPMGYSMGYSFWNVLQEHVAISRRKIAHLHDILGLRQLTSMSPKTIAIEGFQTLQLMLGGTEPTTLPEIYALVHIAYTSLAVFGGNASDNLKLMFVSLFQLGAVLESSLERKIFEKVATAVWSVPAEADSIIDLSVIQQSLHLEPLMSTNSLIQACTHFLDLVERSRPVDQFPLILLPHSSMRTTTCQSEEFCTVIKLDVTVPLISTPSLECFIKDVASVEKHLEEGLIATVRQVELELLWICKTSSQSDLLYNRFLRILFESCDTAHNRLFQCDFPRTEYHMQDVNLVLETISSIEEKQNESVKSSSTPRDIPVTASPISFTSPSTVSSPYDSHPSPSFTFSPPTSTITLSNTSSFSSIQSTKAQGTSSIPSPLSTSLSSTRVLKCPICGYEPDACGIQKWKAGNLKRHMRSTHNGKRYECTFEGCGRVFIGRKDNLLSHQRDKGHLPLGPSSFIMCEDDFVMEDV